MLTLEAKQVKKIGENASDLKRLNKCFPANYNQKK